MAITDAARNHLFNTLTEKLGPDDAATMMDLLPPTGWADVARQRDLDRVEAAMELRFIGVDRRFDEVDRRFDEVDRRFERVDQRFDEMDRRFEQVDQRFDQFEARIEARMAERFGALDQRFGALDQRFGALDQRFATREDLRAQTNRFIGWMVASNATLVATVGLITSLS